MYIDVSIYIYIYSIRPWYSNKIMKGREKETLNYRYRKIIKFNKELFII